MEKIEKVEKEVRTLKFIVIMFTVLLVTFAGFYFYEKMLNVYDECNDAHINENTRTVVETVYVKEKAENNAKEEVKEEQTTTTEETTTE